MTPDALAEYLRHLASSDAAARRAAAQTLATLGVDARPAALALVDLANDPDESVQESVVETLESLGPPDAEILPALVERLRSESSDVGYWAATLIGRLESRAASATDALARALSEHPAIAVRERSAWALGKIGPAASAARGTLEAAAAGSAPRLARLAKDSLQRIGPAR